MSEEFYKEEPDFYRETPLLFKFFSNCPQGLNGIDINSNEGVFDEGLLNEISSSVMCIDSVQVQMSLSNLIDAIERDLYQIDTILEDTLKEPYFYVLMSLFNCSFGVKLTESYLFVQLTRLFNLFSISKETDKIIAFFQPDVVMRMISLIEDPDLIFGPYIPPIIPKISLDSNEIGPTEIEIHPRKSGKPDEIANIRMNLLNTLYNLINNNLELIEEFREANIISSLMPVLHTLLKNDASDNLLNAVLTTEGICVYFFFDLFSPEELQDIFDHFLSFCYYDGLAGISAFRGLCFFFDNHTEMQIEYLTSEGAISLFDKYFHDLFKNDTSVIDESNFSPQSEFPPQFDFQTSDCEEQEMENHRMMYEDFNENFNYTKNINQRNFLIQAESNFKNIASHLLTFLAILAKSKIDEFHYLFLDLLTQFPFYIFGDVKKHPETNESFAKCMHEILVYNATSMDQLNGNNMLIPLIDILFNGNFQTKSEALLALLDNIDEFPIHIVILLLQNNLLNGIYPLIGSEMFPDEKMLFSGLISILNVLERVGGDDLTCGLNNISSWIDEIEDRIDDFSDEEVFAFCEKFHSLYDE